MHQALQVTTALANDRAFSRQLPTPRPLQLRPGEPMPTAAAGQRRIAALALGPELDSCRLARAFTREILQGWDMDAPLEDAVTVASELVSNAVRHGCVRADEAARQARIELILWWRLSHLVCVVNDPSLAPPVLAPTDVFAESGRGLHMVQAIASAWGWTTLSLQQKVVWAALPLQPQTCKPPPDSGASSQEEAPGVADLGPARLPVAFTTGSCSRPTRPRTSQPIPSHLADA
jgi:hypothetical protein